MSHQVPAVSKAILADPGGSPRRLRRVEAIDVPEHRLLETIREQFALDDAAADLAAPLR
jgi:hypothetical protein